MRPLDGLRVLDFTQFLAGPYCTMLLGDLGAEVILIERPDQGTVYRSYGPKFINGESTSFLGVHRNKKSLAVNLKTAEGQELVKRLVKTADIVVENFSPGTMSKFGLEYEKVKEMKPDVIYASISGFGQTGPYSRRGGFDLILQGMSGLMSITGYQDRPPAKVGVPITDLGAGAYSALSILAAVIYREKTGEGQHIDASLMEAGIGFNILTAINYFADGSYPKRMGSASPQNSPYQAYETKDSYITIGTGNQQNWRKMCRIFDMEHLLENTKYENNSLRVANTEELNAEIAPIIKQYSRDECLQMCEEAGIPAGPIYNIDEVLADPHVKSRDLLDEFEHPKAGKVKNIRFPVKFSVIDTSVKTPPPALSEHCRELMLEVGYADEEIRDLEIKNIVGRYENTESE